MLGAEAALHLAYCLIHLMAGLRDVTLDLVRALSA
jgi:succinate dehydrogenase hydrophobic anchor subunit